CCVYTYAVHPHLHSFPTRRSSDLRDESVLFAVLTIFYCKFLQNPAINCKVVTLNRIFLICNTRSAKRFPIAWLSSIYCRCIAAMHGEEFLVQLYPTVPEVGPKTG